MGKRDKDREKEYSPNPDFNRPKPKLPETPEAKMAADRAWCKAAGTPELFYEWYPLMRPPQRMRGGRGGRGGR